MTDKHPAKNQTPLDPAMWGLDAIASTWTRRDTITADELRGKDNVAEWVTSTPERSAAFSPLVDKVRADTRAWGVETRGVFPSGVGGLTLAVVRGDHHMVGKWVAEPATLAGITAMAIALGDAGLGPQVLDTSAHGYLMERVTPGWPLRSLPPTCERVLDAARLLPMVRTLSVPLTLLETQPFLAMRAGAKELAGNDTDGFGARVLEALDELTSLVDAPPAVAHGEYQLGNILTSDSTPGGLLLIDAPGASDAGHLDAARLAVQATCDAVGSGYDWAIEDSVVAIAEAAEVDVGAVAGTARVMAANTALHIKRRVPKRSWEWRACDAMCAALR